MRLYIAGKMKGMPRFNFPAFMDAANRLRVAGYQVHNPAEADILRDGFNPDRDVPRPLSYYTPQNERAIRNCDGIALLPGWETSDGTGLEIRIAFQAGMPVLTVGNWLSKIRHCDTTVIQHGQDKPATGKANRGNCRLTRKTKENL